ncbi:MAG: DUF917 domain-containing protein [Bacillota bacterium]
MASWIGEREIEDLAIGAAILGSGGGGDPYLGKLMAQKAIKKYGKVKLLSPHELPDDALIIPSGMMGAPSVGVEKVPVGNEVYMSFKGLEEYLGKKAYAIMPLESGGMNSTIPFAVAAQAAIPIVDADGMGRAFPEIQMITFHVYGLKGSPMVMHSFQGDYCLIKTTDNYRLERISRAVAVQMGGDAYVAAYSMTGKDVKEMAVPNTISFGIRLGQAVSEALERKENPLDALINVTGQSSYGRAIVLFKGKIIDVEKQIGSGFIRGHVSVEGFEEYKGKLLNVYFQNENKIAIVDGQVVASVPDLITLLEKETANPITTEALKYGYRIVALGIPTPELMRTEEALKVWGPRCFGYDINYVPLEELHREYYLRHMF